MEGYGTRYPPVKSWRRDDLFTYFPVHLQSLSCLFNLLHFVVPLGAKKLPIYCYKFFSSDKNNAIVTIATMNLVRLLLKQTQRTEEADGKQVPSA